MSQPPLTLEPLGPEGMEAFLDAVEMAFGDRA